MVHDIIFVRERTNLHEHFPLCPPTPIFLAPAAELEGL
jgi:hypothetical protein